MVERWDRILDDIPNRDSIRLTRGELLLLDWVLCTGSSLLAPITEDLMSWQDFRLVLWESMPEPDESGVRPSLGVMFDVGDIDAKVLLCAVPTTFSWGDGSDCGFSLKLKLAQRLSGKYTDPKIQQDIDDAKEAENASKDETENQAQSEPATGD